MTTSPELATFVDVLMSECATTEKDGARLCAVCGEEFAANKFHPNQRHCSRACQNHSARDMQAEMEQELKRVARNIAYCYLNRDRYIGIDGRYEGPMNKSVTFVETLVKDKGYHPMPIDVHVRAVEPKFTQVTPEDVDWGYRQGRPTQMMPRKHHSFCAVCVEMVIDKDARKVRTTKGVYLPIAHKCSSVRVYDLKGNLLEIKSL